MDRRMAQTSTLHSGDLLLPYLGQIHTSPLSRQWYSTPDRRNRMFHPNWRDVGIGRLTGNPLQPSSRGNEGAYEQHYDICLAVLSSTFRPCTLIACGSRFVQCTAVFGVAVSCRAFRVFWRQSTAGRFPRTDNALLAVMPIAATFHEFHKDLNDLLISKSDLFLAAVAKELAVLNHRSP